MSLALSNTEIFLSATGFCSQFHHCKFIAFKRAGDTPGKNFAFAGVIDQRQNIGQSVNVCF